MRRISILPRILAALLSLSLALPQSAYALRNETTEGAGLEELVKTLPPPSPMDRPIPAAGLEETYRVNREIPLSANRFSARRDSHYQSGVYNGASFQVFVVEQLESSGWNKEDRLLPEPQYALVKLVEGNKISVIERKGNVPEEIILKPGDWPEGKKVVYLHPASVNISRTSRGDLRIRWNVTPGYRPPGAFQVLQAVPAAGAEEGDRAGEEGLLSPVREHIRQAMEHKGFNQHKLAKRAGVKQSQISRFLAGESDIESATLRWIIQALEPENPLPTKEVIREAMERKGLNQRKLARHAGVTQGQISRFFAGGRDLRSASFFEVMKALDFKVERWGGLSQITTADPAADEVVREIDLTAGLEEALPYSDEDRDTMLGLVRAHHVQVRKGSSPPILFVTPQTGLLRFASKPVASTGLEEEERGVNLLPPLKAHRQIEEFLEAMRQGMAENGGYQSAAVVDLRGLADKKVIFVGDMHGYGGILERVLERENMEDENTLLILMGDAVHREDEQDWPEMDSSIRQVQKAMELKIRYPRRVYYLLGNHDRPTLTVKVNLHHRKDLLHKGRPYEIGKAYFEKLQERYGSEYVEKYRKFLTQSPLLVIGDGWAAVHAGPIAGATLDQIRDANVASILGPLKEMDPIVDQAVNGREYYIDSVKEFLQNLGLPQGSRLVTSHYHLRTTWWYRKLLAFTQDPDWVDVVHNIYAGDRSRFGRWGYARTQNGALELVKFIDGEPEGGGIERYPTPGDLKNPATGLEERVPGWLKPAFGADWMKVVTGVHEIAQVTDKVAVLLQPELLGVAGDDRETQAALRSMAENLHGAFGWPDETSLQLGLLTPESVDAFEGKGYRVIRVVRHPESEETPLPWEAIPIVVAEALAGGQPTFWVNVTPYLNLKGITLPEILATLTDLFA